jgi:hypothetical protein
LEINGYRLGLLSQSANSTPCLQILVASLKDEESYFNLTNMAACLAICHSSRADQYICDA